VFIKLCEGGRERSIFRNYLVFIKDGLHLSAGSKRPRRSIIFGKKTALITFSFASILAFPVGKIAEKAVYGSVLSVFLTT